MSDEIHEERVEDPPLVTRKLWPNFGELWSTISVYFTFHGLIKLVEIGLQVMEIGLTHTVFPSSLFIFPRGGWSVGFHICIFVAQVYTYIGHTFLSFSLERQTIFEFLTMIFVMYYSMSMFIIIDVANVKFADLEEHLFLYSLMHAICLLQLILILKMDVMQKKSNKKKFEQPKKTANLQKRQRKSVFPGSVYSYPDIPLEVLRASRESSTETLATTQKTFETSAMVHKTEDSENVNEGDSLLGEGSGQRSEVVHKLVILDEGSNKRKHSTRGKTSDLNRCSVLSTISEGSNESLAGADAHSLPSSSTGDDEGAVSSGYTTLPTTLVGGDEGAVSSSCTTLPTALVGGDEGAVSSETDTSGDPTLVTTSVRISATQLNPGEIPVTFSSLQEDFVISLH